MTGAFYEDVSAFIVSIWRRICVYCIYMKTYLRLLYLYEDVSAFIISIWRRICVYCIYMKTYLRLLYLYEDVSAFIVSMWIILRKKLRKSQRKSHFIFSNFFFPKLVSLCVTVKNTKYIVAFPLQLLLRERVTIWHSTYLTYLVLCNMTAVPPH